MCGGNPSPIAKIAVEQALEQQQQQRQQQEQFDQQMAEQKTRYEEQKRIANAPPPPAPNPVAGAPAAALEMANVSGPTMTKGTGRKKLRADIPGGARSSTLGIPR